MISASETEMVRTLLAYKAIRLVTPFHPLHEVLPVSAGIYRQIELAQSQGSGGVGEAETACTA